jgi:hypothetical protein
MKTKTEILSLLGQAKPELLGRFKVSRIGLFGSYAREEAGPGSDVDVLVEVDPSIGLDFVTLALRVEEILGLPVDLVSHRAVKPRMMPFVERDLVYV